MHNDLETSERDQGLLGNLLKHRILLIKSEGAHVGAAPGWERFTVKKTNFIAACVYRLWYSIWGTSFHYKTAQKEVKQSLLRITPIHTDKLHDLHQLSENSEDAEVGAASGQQSFTVKKTNFIAACIDRLYKTAQKKVTESIEWMNAEFYDRELYANVDEETLQKANVVINEESNAYEAYEAYEADVDKQNFDE